MIILHPDFYTVDADEAGSTRYECMIMYVKLPHKVYNCKLYDLISSEGVFMVLERSPDYTKPIEVEYKPGVAVKSAKNAWAWWFHLNDKGVL